MFVFVVIFQRTFIAAKSALPSSIFAMPGIVFGEFMAIDTVSLPRLYASCPDSSSQIFTGADCFEMIWIYARSISTKMVDNITDRYFAFCQFVRKSMRRYRSFRVNSKCPITDAHSCGEPQPTTFSLLNLNPKSLFSRDHLFLIPRDKHTFEGSL